MQKVNSSELFRKSLIIPLILPRYKYLLESHFTFTLDVTPEEIWPFIIDTSRMNKEMGFGARTEQEINGENHVSTVTLGREEVWVEKPWQWVDQQELQNHRVFKKGWMTEQKAVFKVQAVGEKVIIHTYFAWAFASLFSKLLFLLSRGVLHQRMENFFSAKEKLIKETRKTEDEQAVPSSEPAVPKQALINYIKVADELDIDRIQLKKVSQTIRIPFELLLDSAKMMVDEGLLTLSWDVICPHCRGVRAETTDVSDIKYQNSCEACNIDFTIDAEESVEIVFHPTAKLREVKKVVYCAGEPSKKRHMKVVQKMSPGDKKTFTLKMNEGFYRARTSKSTRPFSFQVIKGSGSSEIQWDGSFKEDATVGSIFEFTIFNPHSEEINFVIEEAWWKKDRLFPGEVLSHPTLRELFSKAHLSLGVRLNVGQQVILFTDIVGSTPFYKTSGDVAAFKAVQEHYQEVSDLVKTHKGTVVKFIGDAVMAAFLDIENAFRCSIALQEKFHANRQDSPIRLRVSLGWGPVLCANMNVGLDYFGNTVNQSAKIQKWAGSHEIALTSEDWEKLKNKFPQMRPIKILKDDKLGVEVQIIKVA